MFRKVLISDSLTHLHQARLQCSHLLSPGVQNFRARECSYLYRNNLTTNQPQSVPKLRLHLMSVFVIGFAAATSSALAHLRPMSSNTYSLNQFHESSLLFSHHRERDDFRVS